MSQGLKISLKLTNAKCQHNLEVGAGCFLHDGVRRDGDVEGGAVAVLVSSEVLAEPKSVDGRRHEDDLGRGGGDLAAELLDEEEHEVHGLVALVDLVDEDVRPPERFLSPTRVCERVEQIINEHHYLKLLSFILFNTELICSVLCSVRL